MKMKQLLMFTLSACVTLFVAADGFSQSLANTLKTNYRITDVTISSPEGSFASPNISNDLISAGWVTFKVTLEDVVSATPTFTLESVKCNEPGVDRPYILLDMPFNGFNVIPGVDGVATTTSTVEEQPKAYYAGYEIPADNKSAVVLKFMYKVRYGDMASEIAWKGTNPFGGTIANLRLSGRPAGGGNLTSDQSLSTETLTFSTAPAATTTGAVSVCGFEMTVGATDNDYKGPYGDAVVRGLMPITLSVPAGVTVSQPSGTQPTIAVWTEGGMVTTATASSLASTVDNKAEVKRLAAGESVVVYVSTPTAADGTVKVNYGYNAKAGTTFEGVYQTKTFDVVAGNADAASPYMLVGDSLIDASYAVTDGKIQPYADDATKTLEVPVLTAGAAAITVKELTISAGQTAEFQVFKTVLEKTEYAGWTASATNPPLVKFASPVVPLTEDYSDVTVSTANAFSTGAALYALNIPGVDTPAYLLVKVAAQLSTLTFTPVASTNGVEYTGTTILEGGEGGPAAGTANVLKYTLTVDKTYTKERSYLIAPVTDANTLITKTMDSNLMAADGTTPLKALDVLDEIVTISAYDAPDAADKGYGIVTIPAGQLSVDFYVTLRNNWLLAQLADLGFSVTVGQKATSETDPTLIPDVHTVRRLRLGAQQCNPISESITGTGDVTSRYAQVAIRNVAPVVTVNPPKSNAASNTELTFTVTAVDAVGDYLIVRFAPEGGTITQMKIFVDQEAMINTVGLAKWLDIVEEIVANNKQNATDSFFATDENGLLTGDNVLDRGVSETVSTTFKHSFADPSADWVITVEDSSGEEGLADGQLTLATTQKAMVYTYDNMRYDGFGIVEWADGSSITGNWSYAADYMYSGMKRNATNKIGILRAVPLLAKAAELWNFSGLNDVVASIKKDSFFYEWYADEAYDGIITSDPYNPIVQIRRDYMGPDGNNGANQQGTKPDASDWEDFIIRVRFVQEYTKDDYDLSTAGKSYALMPNLYSLGDMNQDGVPDGWVLNAFTTEARELIATRLDQTAAASGETLDKLPAMGWGGGAAAYGINVRNGRPNGSFALTGSLYDYKTRLRGRDEALNAATGIIEDYITEDTHGGPQWISAPKFIVAVHPNDGSYPGSVIAAKVTKNDDGTYSGWTPQWTQIELGTTAADNPIYTEKNGWSGITRSGIMYDTGDIVTRTRVVDGTTYNTLWAVVLDKDGVPIRPGAKWRGNLRYTGSTVRICISDTSVAKDATFAQSGSEYEQVRTTYTGWRYRIVDKNGDPLEIKWPTNGIPADDNNTPDDDTDDTEAVAPGKAPALYEDYDLKTDLNTWGDAQWAPYQDSKDVVPLASYVTGKIMYPFITPEATTEALADIVETTKVDESLTDNVGGILVTGAEVVIEEGDPEPLASINDLLDLDEIRLVSKLGYVYHDVRTQLGLLADEPFYAYSHPKTGFIDPAMTNWLSRANGSYDQDGDGLPNGLEYFFWYFASRLGYAPVYTHTEEYTVKEGDEDVIYTRQIDAALVTALDPAISVRKGGVNRDSVYGFEDIFTMGRRFLSGWEPGNGVEPDSSKGNLWEGIPVADIIATFHPLSHTSNDDPDNDGLGVMAEIAVGTNPIDFDTDGDLIPDGWEVLMGKSEDGSWISDPTNGKDGSENKDGDFFATATVTLYPERHRVWQGVSYNWDDEWVFVTYNHTAGTVTYEGETRKFDPSLVDPKAAATGTEGEKDSYPAATVWTKVPVEPTDRDPDDLVAGNADGTGPGSGWTEEPTVTELTSKFEAQTAKTIRLRDSEVYRHYGFNPHTGWLMAKDLTALGTKFNLFSAVHTAPFTNLEEYLSGFRVSKTATRKNNASDIQHIVNCSTSPANADTNDDGMPDGWSYYVGIDPIQTNVDPGELDTDDDGINNRNEFNNRYLTLIARKDAGSYLILRPSMYAMVSDEMKNSSWYNKLYPSDPNNPDTDFDGLADGLERNIASYTPVLVEQPGVEKDEETETTPEIEPTPDTETAEGETADAGPLFDTGDNSPIGGGCDPCSADTDKDGLSDGWEAAYYKKGLIDPTNPTDSDLDADRDGLSNVQEYLTGFLRHTRYDLGPTQARMYTSNPGTRTYDAKTQKFSWAAVADLPNTYSVADLMTPAVARSPFIDKEVGVENSILVNPLVHGYALTFVAAPAWDDAFAYALNTHWDRTLLMPSKAMLDALKETIPAEGAMKTIYDTILVAAEELDAALARATTRAGVTYAAPFSQNISSVLDAYVGDNTTVVGLIHLIDQAMNDLTPGANDPLWLQEWIQGGMKRLWEARRNMLLASFKGEANKVADLTYLPPATDDIPKPEKKSLAEFSETVAPATKTYESLDAATAAYEEVIAADDMPGFIKEPYMQAIRGYMGGIWAMPIQSDAFKPEPAIYGVLEALAARDAKGAAVHVTYPDATVFVPYISTVAAHSIIEDYKTRSEALANGVTTTFFGGALTNGYLKALYKPATDSATPLGMATTSPISADSDLDGMDDYWEVFHGLNPLLGDVGTSTYNASIGSINPDGTHVDRIAAAHSGFARPWTMNQFNSPYLYEQNVTGFNYYGYPWMAGLPYADPDGDGLINSEEAINGIIGGEKTRYGTDPSPLWMTDPNSSYSFVTRFYSLMSVVAPNYPTPNLVTVDDVSNYLSARANEPATFDPLTSAMPFVARAEMFSPDLDGSVLPFEVNEGFDTDGDGIADMTELTHNAFSGDPQSLDTPVRQHAAYFGGKGAMQSAFNMPISPTALNTFTIECWVKPDAPAAGVEEMVLIDRPWRFSDDYKFTDDDVRHTFTLGLKVEGGELKPFVRYTGAGTTNLEGADTPVKVVKTEATSNIASGTWTHLAASYDGVALALYINGEPAANATKSLLTPATGVISLSYMPNGEITDQSEDPFTFRYSTRPAPLLIGATAGTWWDANLAMAALTNDINTIYASPYTGFIDEVRVWNGVRTEDQIKEHYLTPYTTAELLANRTAVLKARHEGNGFFAQIGQENVVELLAYYTFNDLLGGTKDEAGTATDAPWEVYPGQQTIGDATVPGSLLYRRSGIANEMVNLESVIKDEMPVSSRLVYDSYYSILPEVLKSTQYMISPAETAGTVTIPANYEIVPTAHNVMEHLPRVDVDRNIANTQQSVLYWRGTLASLYLPSGSWENVKPADSVYWSPYGVARQTMPELDKKEINEGNIPEVIYPNLRTTGNPYTYRYTTNVEFDETRYYPIDAYDYTAHTDLWIFGDTFAKYDPESWFKTPSTDPADPITPTYGGDDDNPENPNYDPTEDITDPNVTVDQLVDEDGKAVSTWFEKINGRSVIGTVQQSVGAAWLEDNVYARTDGYLRDTDPDNDGMLSWWEKYYGLDHESAEGEDGAYYDNDYDGLPNFSEFMARANPVKASTMGTGTPDAEVPLWNRRYRPTLGFLFSDYDFLEDHVEAQYRDENKLTPNLADATADADGDGWSNWSEFRAKTHLTSAFAEVKEVPELDEEGNPVLDEEGNPVMTQEVLDPYPFPTFDMYVKGLPESAESEDEESSSSSTTTASTTLILYAYRPGNVAPDAIFSLPYGEVDEQNQTGITLESGHLREGPANFFVFVDENGDSRWNAGEAAGMAYPRNVYVGFDRVVEPLSVDLTRRAPSGTIRFSLSDMAKDLFASTETGETTDGESEGSSGSSGSSGSDEESNAFDYASAKNRDADYELVVVARSVQSPTGDQPIGNYELYHTPYKRTDGRLALTEYDIYAAAPTGFNYDGNYASMDCYVLLVPKHIYDNGFVPNEASIEKFSAHLENGKPACITSYFDRLNTPVLRAPLDGILYNNDITFEWEANIQVPQVDLTIRTADGKLVYAETGLVGAPAYSTSTGGNNIYRMVLPDAVGRINKGSSVYFGNGEYTFDLTLKPSSGGTKTLSGKFALHFTTSASTVAGSNDNEPPTNSNQVDSAYVRAQIHYNGMVDDETLAEGRLVVEAYTSPSLAGRPLGVTSAPMTLDQTLNSLVKMENTQKQYLPTEVDETEAVDGVTIVNVEKFHSTTFTAEVTGLYTAKPVYLLAYLDLNANNVRDTWEPWGYVYEGKGYTGGDDNLYYTPKALTPHMATTDLHATFYIRDVDADNDKLVDAWEWIQGGYSDADFSVWCGDITTSLETRGQIWKTDAETGIAKLSAYGAQLYGIDLVGTPDADGYYALPNLGDTETQALLNGTLTQDALVELSKQGYSAYTIAVESIAVADGAVTLTWRPEATTALGEQADLSDVFAKAVSGTYVIWGKQSLADTEWMYVTQADLTEAVTSATFTPAQGYLFYKVLLTTLDKAAEAEAQTMHLLAE